MPLVFLQTQRPIQVSTALGPDRLLLTSVTGTEAVNELFEFRLGLIAPLSLPPISFDDIVGQSAAVQMIQPGGGFRVINGIITAFTQRGRTKQFIIYEADLRPAWWPATLRLNSRIFQQQTAPEILQIVLGPFGPLSMNLTGNYPIRTYTTQYRETDWAFACRIMEEEGICFFFQHTADSHTLTFGDAVGSFTTVPGPVPLQYDDSPNAPSMTTPIAWRWDKTQELVPTTTTLWDSHFQLFTKNLAGQATATAQVTAGLVEHHPALPKVPPIPVYRHDGDYAKRYDGVAPGGGDQSSQLTEVYADAERTATLRQEQSIARSIRVNGTSNSPNLIPGFLVTLVGHYDGDDQYIITRTAHTATIPQSYWAADTVGDYEYQNEFEVAPTTLIPRPPLRTPRPKVGGPLTAIVTGPSGQEIFVDQYGRVKVQFFWDQAGNFNANSSCWVRVSQLWAGKTWGAFFWPRIGMEVIVHFVYGDPDRPLITGCVYNATNQPPTNLPVEATIGGIKSLIFGGDPSANFNAIYIHDTSNVEYIQVHSERNEVQNSESGKFHYTAGIEVRVQGRL